jgi:hypothetical protein
MASAADVAQRLTMVLGELVFPAARWSIQTYVDHYGADIHTRREIWELPSREYLTLGDVIDAVIPRGPQSVTAVSGRRRTEPLTDRRPGRCCDGCRRIA